MEADRAGAAWLWGGVRYLITPTFWSCWKNYMSSLILSAKACLSSLAGSVSGPRDIVRTGWTRVPVSCSWHSGKSGETDKQESQVVSFYLVQKLLTSGTG